MTELVKESIEQIKALFAFPTLETRVSPKGRKWSFDYRYPHGTPITKDMQAHYDEQITSLADFNSAIMSYEDIAKYGEVYKELTDEQAAQIALDRYNSEIMVQLSNKISQAIAEAESFADETGLDFDISPAYGMGGTYDGARQEWRPSSQSC